MDNSGYASENGGNNEHTVDIEMDTRVKSAAAHNAKVGVAEMTDKKVAPLATEPYSGMGKDDLLRFSQTPFWNRLRLIFLVVFWCAWLAMILAVIILTILSPRCSTAPTVDWLQRDVVYQVYVRSFFDSDNDGIGDLKGVSHKLDYLQTDLKVDTILLSSVFRSHVAPDVTDFGYDIVDHRDIHPDYGTLLDFDELVNATHAKGMRLMVDYVPNHTGWSHPWFVASNSSGDPDTNPYWNFYVWADCTTQEPTNWRSVYGGSAWTYGRGGVTECYLHQLMNHQPELNLRSSAVRAELEGILRFWLDRGVDGFRVTSSKFLYEDADLRDEMVEPGCTDPNDYNCLHHNYTTSQHENHDIIASWRNILEEYTHNTGRSRVLITDANEYPEVAVRYYGRTADIGAHLPLNYQLSDVTEACLADLCVNTLVSDWLSVVPAFATSSWIVGNQDLSRLASNVGETYGRALLMLQMTLPGVPVTYYGDELGMVNGNYSGPSVDPAGPGFSRDNYRLPMQWSDALNAGFSNATTTWLPVNYDYVTRNAHMQLTTEDTHTHAKLFSSLAKLHKEESALHYGNMHNMSTGFPDVMAYVREFDGTNRLLVVINFGTVERHVSPTYFLGPFYVEKEADIVITTHAEMGQGEPGTMYGVDLHPGQGIIYSWPYMR